MQVIIDRFEGAYAVVESEAKSMQKIKREEIPSAAREGDVLIHKDNIWTIDREASLERKQKIAALA
ncbi:MAG: DUF3006 domain-containing protein, partial [Syntrophomonadaceae bacterium]|nr:DUF3006 domain-containing protein [Syntrophomonadaceae bacterium]